jgi:hypothetical protein
LHGLGLLHQAGELSFIEHGWFPFLKNARVKNYRGLMLPGTTLAPWSRMSACT